MTLSYLQAFCAKESGTISWEEYIHNLFARFSGIKHDQDNVKGMYSELRKTDPFGYGIYCWSNTVETMKDTSSLEAVFNAYRRSTLEDVQNKFALLDGSPAKEVKKSLAFLALQERRPDVLKFYLDQGGFPFEGYFVVEAESVDEKKDPETFNVLEQSRFRQLWPRKAPDSGGNNGKKPHPAATFDIGGKLPVHW